jgi:2,3-bisphosphoglycerate-dependent phosphoglycerate mutase
MKDFFRKILIKITGIGLCGTPYLQMNKSEEDKNLCTLYLVRHGETEWNVKGITQGHTNSFLTEKGKQQALDTANEFKDIKFDAIFSSDLIRTQHTAEIIKLDREIIIQTSKLLRERNFGSFEGRHGNEFREAIKEKLLEREKLSKEDDWSFRLNKDVETDEEIVNRFIVQLREISVAYPDKTVLVVSHGGPIRMFLAKTAYKTKEELTSSNFKNGGYIKVLSDGVNFYIKDVKGIVMLNESE